jgi:hypothetical protein
VKQAPHIFGEFTKKSWQNLKKDCQLKNIFIYEDDFLLSFRGIINERVVTHEKNIINPDNIEELPSNFKYKTGDGAPALVPTYYYCT